MLEINRKTDILIPFEKIGENGWERNTRRIIEAVADMNGDALPHPIPAVDITILESELGTNLPEGLKLFYTTFGLANIGEQLLEFGDITPLKDTWSEAPEYAPDFTEEDAKLLPFLITFSDGLGGGDIFCFHTETKEVYLFDDETTPYITKIFNSVDNYIKGCLILAQSDLFGEEADEEDSAHWAEECAITMFGNEIVAKWRF